MPDLSVGPNPGRACPACKHSEHSRQCDVMMFTTPEEGLPCGCDSRSISIDMGGLKATTKPKPAPVPGGIYDLSKGQCTAAAVLKGEHIPCELAKEHDGWAHQNLTHELLWQNAQRAYTGIRGAGGVVAVGGAGGGGGRGVGGAIAYGQRGPE